MLYKYTLYITIIIITKRHQQLKSGMDVPSGVVVPERTGTPFR